MINPKVLELAITRVQQWRNPEARRIFNTEDLYQYYLDILIDAAEQSIIQQKQFASAGGKARAAKLSPSRRKEIAKKAVNTRWKNRKGK